MRSTLKELTKVLDKLTIESFAPHVGTSFWLQAENRKIELRLTRAAKVMESEAPGSPGRRSRCSS